MRKSKVSYIKEYKNYWRYWRNYTNMIIASEGKRIIKSETNIIGKSLDLTLSLPIYLKSPIIELIGFGFLTNPWSFSCEELEF
jgi:hypothetical protein